MNGPYFAYWLGVGCMFLIFVVAGFVCLDIYERWNEERGKSSDRRQFLKLSAIEKARLYNQLKAKSSRPSIRLANRGRNDAA